MSIRVLLTAAALLTLAGCTSHAAPTQHAAAKTTASAPADPYDVYAAKDKAAGVAVKILRSDALGVANVTCGSSLDTMTGFVSLMQSEYAGTELRDGLVNYANFIDAYCPNARSVYDAATQQTVGQVIPTAH